MGDSNNLNANPNSNNNNKKIDDPNDILISVLDEEEDEKLNAGKVFDSSVNSNENKQKQSAPTNISKVNNNNSQNNTDNQSDEEELDEEAKKARVKESMAVLDQFANAYQNKIKDLMFPSQRPTKEELAKETEIVEQQNKQQYVEKIKATVLTPFIADLQDRIEQLEREKKQYKNSLILRHFTSGKEAKIEGLTELKKKLEGYKHNNNLELLDILYAVKNARKNHPHLTKSSYGDRTVTMLDYYYQMIKHSVPGEWSRSMINERINELTYEQNRVPRNRKRPLTVKEQKISALISLQVRLEETKDTTKIAKDVININVEKPIIHSGVFSQRTSKLLHEMIHIEDDYKAAERKYNLRFPKK